MRKKYYSKDIKAKIKYPALPFNVYFQGANKQRAEILRQKNHVLLLQRKMNRKKSSKLTGSKMSKRTSEKRRHQSIKRKENKERKTGKREGNNRFFQTRKGKSAKSKIGGKFTFHEYKNDLNRMKIGSRFTKMTNKKTNQWGTTINNSKGEYDIYICMYNSNNRWCFYSNNR